MSCDAVSDRLNTWTLPPHGGVAESFDVVDADTEPDE